MSSQTAPVCPGCLSRPTWRASAAPLCEAMKIFSSSLGSRGSTVCAKGRDHLVDRHEATVWPIIDAGRWS